MNYYLIGIFFTVVLSFFLAMRNERKFQRELDKLVVLRKEIEDVSVRLERLNLNKEVHKKSKKILFSSSYELMDYEFIMRGFPKSSVCFKSELDLLRSYTKYSGLKHKTLANGSKKNFICEEGLDKKQKLDRYSDFSNHSYA